MSNHTTENPGHDNMEVSALTVKEVIETEVDELSLDALVGEGMKLKIKNMIDIEVFAAVPKLVGEKTINGRGVLKRKGPDTCSDLTRRRWIRESPKTHGECAV